MEERKRILKLVEEGKLTAEEAIILLESLEKNSEEKRSKQDEIVSELARDAKGSEEAEDNIFQALSTNIFSSSNSRKSGSSFDKAKFEKQASSFKNNIMDFVGSALQKIKDLDLDFNFGPSISIQHIFQQSDVHLQQIDLDVANGSVKVVPWQENDVKIECEAKVYEENSQDDARKAFLSEVLFSIEAGKLRFSVQKKHIKVQATVYVPEREYDNLHVRMFNGPIDGEGLHVKSMKLKSANGSITWNRLTSDYMEVETANGHIRLTDCNSKELEAETINGMLKVKGDIEKLDLQSFNGNVVGELTGSAARSILAKTKTGSVDLFLSTDNAVEAELKTNLGSFTCEIPGMDVVEEKNEVVQKALHFKANKENSPLTYIMAETTTGSILIKPYEVKAE
ncbi:DUF4097 family beta strand repeat-containing protein [Sutcliffiella rhizosphaerae]|uniref:Adhesin domain-containing protein n=1 Tax=Sutcliffiella rhizosphaerae TaxID=2880967 RepID=A0ABM8YL92_9BACI|nr:DUF4097 domain-containing protein [Sutcliffiella rhizosphaerae]CAG9620692.1 hypothetical protein BACCIP111883_01461 [Sutcliffiella rhizosphaerae]